MTKPLLNYEEQTQNYSTWGDKLLQHTDVLYGIQNNKVFRPITIQLAPTEACDSDCVFCSVQNRPVKEKISFNKIVSILKQFKYLGAKSIELTGGGNPLIYRDGKYKFNDIVQVCVDLEYKIGIITNSENLKRHIDPKFDKDISWIRVSLIKLDEGKEPEDFNFDGFSSDKLAFSYIVYSANNYKSGTTLESIKRIEKLVDMHPQIKFVRIAADCLTDEAQTIKQEWGDIINRIDKGTGKYFIKELNDNYWPFKGGCWIGMIRPYIVWNGVYICTSHVLKQRVYLPEFKLCDHDNILDSWNKMNEKFARGESPYDIDINKECWHCYYKNSNAILNSVIKDMPDKEFA
jgi:hypothetical protein